MVITILEAHVEEKNWSSFQTDFKTRTTDLPPQMIQTFLLQDIADQTLWQIVSVWKSREAYDAFAPRFKAAMRERGFEFGEPSILTVNHYIEP